MSVAAETAHNTAAATKPLVVNMPGDRRTTFNVTAWSVTDDGGLSLFGGDQEVATFSPGGWLQVWWLDAEARP